MSPLTIFIAFLIHSSIAQVYYPATNVYPTTSQTVVQPTTAQQSQVVIQNSETPYVDTTQVASTHVQPAVAYPATATYASPLVGYLAPVTLSGIGTGYGFGSSVHTPTIGVAPAKSYYGYSIPEVIPVSGPDYDDIGIVTKVAPSTRPRKIVETPAPKTVTVMEYQPNYAPAPAPAPLMETPFVATPTYKKTINVPTTARKTTTVPVEKTYKDRAPAPGFYAKAHFGFEAPVGNFGNIQTPFSGSPAFVIVQPQNPQLQYAQQQQQLDNTNVLGVTFNGNNNDEETPVRTMVVDANRPTKISFRGERQINDMSDEDL